MKGGITPVTVAAESVFIARHLGKIDPEDARTIRKFFGRPEGELES